MSPTKSQDPRSWVRSINWFLFSAGLLCVALAAAHALWGESNVVGELTAAKITTLSLASFVVSWHQMTVMLALSGIVLLSTALTEDPNRPLVLFILGIIVSNLAVFLFYAGTRFPSVFASTVPQAILFIILITLTLLGLLQATRQAHRREELASRSPHEPLTRVR